MASSVCTLDEDLCGLLNVILAEDEWLLDCEVFLAFPWLAAAIKMSSCWFGFRLEPRVDILIWIIVSIWIFHLRFLMVDIISVLKVLNPIKLGENNMASFLFPANHLVYNILNLAVYLFHFWNHTIKQRDLKKFLTEIFLWHIWCQLEKPGLLSDGNLIQPIKMGVHVEIWDANFLWQGKWLNVVELVNN